MRIVVTKVDLGSAASVAIPKTTGSDPHSIMTLIRIFHCLTAIAWPDVTVAIVARWLKERHLPNALHVI
jgi:hypothetical protein